MIVAKSAQREMMYAIFINPMIKYGNSGSPMHWALLSP